MFIRISLSHYSLNLRSLSPTFDPDKTFILRRFIFNRGVTMKELRELLITKEDYLEYLEQRLRLQGSCQQKIETMSFPFLFTSGSELLRNYILSSTEFTSTLQDEYKLQDRGFLWYLFSQAVREILVAPEHIVIKYELQEDYRKPFKQFYL